MAAASEKNLKSDFTRALSSRPGLYSFYGAVRRLEQLSPDSPRIGTREAALHPAVHFAQVPHLYFPPSELFGYTASSSAGTAPSSTASGIPTTTAANTTATTTGGSVTAAPAAAGTLQVYFFGLFGPNGALPLSLTEYVHERSHHYYDLTMQRFADIFHDRLISRFYRAGTTSQAAASYARERGATLGSAAAALSGVPSPRTGAILPAPAPVTHARDLAEKNRPGTLQHLLEQFFELPVTVREHSPCHLPIREEYRCQLGRTGTCELGRSTLLGDRQRSISEQVTLEIGPISYKQYSRFLPGSTGHRRLQTWLRLMSSRPLSWKLRFHIITASIPNPALDGTCQLGGNALFASSSETTTCTLTINF